MALVGTMTTKPPPVPMWVTALTERGCFALGRWFVRQGATPQQVAAALGVVVPALEQALARAAARPDPDFEDDDEEDDEDEDEDEF